MYVFYKIWYTLAFHVDGGVFCKHEALQDLTKNYKMAEEQCCRSLAAAQHKTVGREWVGFCHCHIEFSTTGCGIIELSVE